MAESEGGKIAPKFEASTAPSFSDVFGDVRYNRKELKKPRTSRKPLTTREKIAAIEADQQKKAKKGRKGVKNRPTACDKPSIMSYLNQQVQMSTDPAVNDALREKRKLRGVLYRPTQRTKEIKESQGGIFSVRIEDIFSTKEQKGANFEVVGETLCKLLTMPDEVRCMIWVKAVVQKDSLIWPTDKAGAEQPDLAMTCRQIRNEVLPVYYGFNIFAIELCLAERTEKGKKSNPKPCVPRWTTLGHVRRWMDILQANNHLYMIKNWALTLYPSNMTASVIWHSGCVVHVYIGTKNRDFDPVVQIHQDARCLMPRSKKYVQCVVKQPPNWLMAAVLNALNCVYEPGVLSGSLIELAKVVREDIEELEELTCEHAVPSIETSD